MATLKDVLRIALSLPDTAERKGEQFGVVVRSGDKEKLLVWSWRERIDPKKARVPNPKVLGVRVADLDEKEAMLAADKIRFFTEPHYNGYPAVLVHLPKMRVAELRQIIGEAWSCVAPKVLPAARKKRPARS